MSKLCSYHAEKNVCNDNVIKHVPFKKVILTETSSNFKTKNFKKCSILFRMVIDY